MRPRGGIIGRRRMRGTNTVPIFYYLLYFTGRKGLFLFQTKNLNFIVLVLQYLQLFLIIQQVHALTAVNLKHTHAVLDVLFVWTDLKNIIDSVLGYRVNGEGLTTAGLSVSKTSDDSILEDYG